LVIDLGEIQANTDVAFDIPKGALGFNITLEGRAADFDPNAPYGIAELTDPAGPLVHKDFTPKGGDKPTSLAVFDPIATVSVPQGEGVPTDLEGTWKMRAGQAGLPSSTLKFKATVRVQLSGDGAFHGGKLDLHLHVPDTLRIDGETIQPADAENNA